MDAERNRNTIADQVRQDRGSSRGDSRQARQERRRLRWQAHMDRRARNCHNMKHSRKGWVGVAIILVGVAWLLNVMGVDMPAWIFSWPMLLVVLGLFSGLASGFRNMGSVIMIFIGLVFLGHNFFWPDKDLERYIWPIVIIFVGILFLLKRRGWEDRKEWGQQWFAENHPHWKGFSPGHSPWQGPSGPENHPPPPSQAPPLPPTEGNAPLTSQGHEAKIPVDQGKPPGGEDWLDVTTIFGGAKRHVISKNFRGGDLVNVCGGTVIDLTHADIHGTVVIDVVAMWGGIKVAVPPNWQVRLNLTHLMAGTDDHRVHRNQEQDPDKILVFTGTVLMAGIEISDFA